MLSGTGEGRGAMRYCHYYPCCCCCCCCCCCYHYYDYDPSPLTPHRDYIAMIRVKYPHFRVGIVHVVCDADIIWDRVQDRCARTGR